ncbi:hypothetical protein [Actinosynnema mirum]|uniref:Uncharacterized protein n=1 Tax=Actinosynnema mirum (strain ATCC 29888 / DSM 43827 / JCM 3225 / NBRC 14064 / NCIMB 13271 / NRRL B-12336 / IMRU 3971 / 101) TaxID=446462 RepID=C6W7W8_ACTMD|nr:hypothetical protein [Actinosynnema mirum]ACU36989.1 hypothetical protein Amir_3073 [Actinosynnema mirum DSM 43827]
MTTLPRLARVAAPGDPGGVRRASAALAEAGEEADAVRAALRAVGDVLSMWPGADGFRGRLERVCADLGVLVTAHATAAKALSGYATELAPARARAGFAQARAASAAEEEADAGRRARAADAEATAHGNRALQAVQRVGYAKNQLVIATLVGDDKAADDLSSRIETEERLARVAGAEHEQAQERAKLAQSEREEAARRLGAAKELAEQARNLRETAARVAAGVLREAVEHAVGEFAVGALESAEPAAVGELGGGEATGGGERVEDAPAVPRAAVGALQVLSRGEPAPDAEVDADADAATTTASAAATDAAAVETEPADAGRPATEPTAAGPADTNPDAADDAAGPDAAGPADTGSVVPELPAARAPLALLPAVAAGESEPVERVGSHRAADPTPAGDAEDPVLSGTIDVEWLTADVLLSPAGPPEDLADWAEFESLAGVVLLGDRIRPPGADLDELAEVLSLDTRLRDQLPPREQTPLAPEPSAAAPLAAEALFAEPAAAEPATASSATAGSAVEGPAAKGGAAKSASAEPTPAKPSPAENPALPAVAERTPPRPAGKVSAALRLPAGWIEIDPRSDAPLPSAALSARAQRAEAERVAKLAGPVALELRKLSEGSEPLLAAVWAGGGDLAPPALTAGALLAVSPAVGGLAQVWASIERAPGAGEVTVSSVELPGGVALLATTEVDLPAPDLPAPDLPEPDLPTPDRALVSRYFLRLPNSDRVAVLSFTTPNTELADRFGEVFAAIAASLRFHAA